jgi:hypothetical protein
MTSIPTDGYPFGNAKASSNNFEDDGVSFDFINAGGDPRIQLVYDKGSCKKTGQYIAKELNLGPLVPIAGIDATITPLNNALFQDIGTSCQTLDNFIKVNNNKVGSLNTNGLGVFAPTYTNSFRDNKLVHMIPEAFSNTTPNAIKNASDATVYGDTTVIPSIGTYRLKDVATFYDKRSVSKVKPNNLERTPKQGKVIDTEETTEEKLRKFLDSQNQRQGRMEKTERKITEKDAKTSVDTPTFS